MNGLTPDVIGAAIAGVVIMLVAFVGVIAKAWDAIKEIRENSKTAQHELTNNHGSSVKDSQDRTETAVTDLTAAVHELKTGLGGIRDDLRLIRRESSQTREEVADLRTTSDATHRDLKAGQEALDRRLDGLDRHTP